MNQPSKNLIWKNRLNKRTRNLPLKKMMISLRKKKINNNRKNFVYKRLPKKTMMIIRIMMIWKNSKKRRLKPKRLCRKRRNLKK
jgi:hypothetical protein